MCGPLQKEAGKRLDVKPGEQLVSPALGCNAGVLRNALHDPAPKYERLIVKRIGTTPQTIWPSRCHADGTPAANAAWGATSAKPLSVMVASLKIRAM